MRFNPHVVHVSGKQQLAADALSRGSVGNPEEDDHNLVEEVESYTNKYITCNYKPPAGNTGSSKSR
jgi:hypothetical protein